MRRLVVLIVIVLLGVGGLSCGESSLTPQAGSDALAAADGLLADAPTAQPGKDAVLDAADDGTGSWPPLQLPTSPVAPMVFGSELPVPAEGLVFHDAHLYLSGTDNRVYRLGGNGEAEDFATLLPVEGGAGNVAGLAVGPDEALYVCRFSANRVERVGISDATDVSVYFKVETPNSLVFRTDGLWYTSSGQGESKGHGHLGRVNGEGIPEVLVGDISYANGLAFSPDGQWVYVSSTDPGSVLRFPLSAGVPGAAQIILDGMEMTAVDGLAVYADGTLFAAGFGTGRIYSWTETGGLRTIAELPAMGLLGTASIAFGDATGFAPTALYATNLLKPGLATIDLAADTL